MTSVKSVGSLSAIMFLITLPSLAAAASSRPVRALGTWSLSTGKAGGTWRAECMLEQGAFVDCDVSLGGFPGRQRFHQAALTGSVDSDASAKDDPDRAIVKGAVTFENATEVTFEGSARGAELTGTIRTTDGTDGRWEGLWFYPATEQLAEPFISAEQSAEEKQ